MRDKTTRSCIPLLVFVSLFFSTTVMAQSRIALVIGNSDYKEARLRNPVNDARDMAQALRDLGFQVIDRYNTTKKQTIEAVNDFGMRLQQAQVGLFYYAGHGMQYNGNNYLIPLQADIGAPADLEQETVDAGRILGRMGESSTTVNIVILDACRNHPFRSLSGFRSYGGRGLAPSPRVRSSLIAYATQPDNVAEDGTGQNGTYTKHLLRYLKQPGLSLPDFFNEVGRAVLQETNGRQEPWVNSSPLSRFCFAGCETPTASVTPSKQTTPPLSSERQSARRMALVIGNSKYHQGPLLTPVNDATDIAATLKRLGFDATLLHDASLRQMSDAIEVFSQQLRKGGVGFFYFAGHGVQVQGENYLLPIGAAVNRAQDVPYEAVPVGRILGGMEDAGNQLNIVILDACRNNPFARTFRWNIAGLTMPQAVRGSIIAYATSPGSVAADGNGRNSLYTQHLLKNMTIPGLGIEQVFRQTRIGVMQDTNGKQAPWESSSLTSDFSFAER